MMTGILDDSRPPGVPELVAEFARRTPDAVALSGRSGNGNGDGFEELTYGETLRRADALAAELHAAGAGVGTVVGVCTERTVQAGIALLGVLRSGATYVPLDPDHPDARLALVAADVGADLVVASSGSAVRAAATGVKVLVLDAAESDPAVLPAAARHEPHPENVAYIVHTSGSTGRPKGVAIGHDSYRCLTAAQGPAFGVTAEDRVLQLASFTFDAWLFEAALAWSVGARLHIAGAHERAGAALAALLDESAATVVTITPTPLWTVPWEPGAFPCLRTLIVCGEPFGADLVARWAPGRSFLNAYGPTEATVCATVAELTAGDKPVIGRPIGGVRVYVLDGRLAPVPAGAAGEVFIGGVGVAHGYVGRAGLTAERFIPDPFSDVPGARMYRTGDIGQWSTDGQVEFLGRVDDQVKVRGHRVEPGEVEAVLRAHPDLDQVAVVARTDQAGQHSLVAYAVPASGENVDAVGLRRFAEQSLPSYMVPSSFIELDAIPVTPHGKIDHAALPAPHPERSELGATGEQPSTQRERWIAELWSDLLQLHAIGRHDDFFDLGGDSLGAMRMVAHLEARTGCRVEASAVFDHRTVAELAAYLDETEPVPAPMIAAIPRPVRRNDVAQENPWN